MQDFGTARDRWRPIARALLVVWALLCLASSAIAAERYRFNWQSQTENYDVQISRSADFVEIVFASRVGRVDSQVTLKPGTYWLRKKKPEETDWSAAREFVVEDRSPASLGNPQLVWPVGAVSFRTETYPFSWTHVEGAKSYEVRLFVEEEEGSVMIASAENLNGPFAKELGGVLAPGRYAWEVTSIPREPTKAVSKVRQEFVVRTPTHSQKGTGRLGVSWLVSNYNYAASLSSRFSRFDTFAFGPEVSGDYWISPNWELTGKLSDRIFPIGTTMLHDTHMKLGLWRALPHADARWSFQLGGTARLDTIPEILPSGGVDTSISQVQTVSAWPGFRASFSEEPNTAFIGGVDLGRNLWVTGRDYRGGATVQYEVMVGAEGFWFYPWGISAEVRDSYRAVNYDYQDYEVGVTINTLEAMIRLTHDF